VQETVISQHDTPDVQFEAESASILIRAAECKPRWNGHPSGQPTRRAAYPAGRLETGNDGEGMSGVSPRHLLYETCKDALIGVSRTRVSLWDTPVTRNRIRMYPHP